jgi:two-component SAPR family response regulator
LIVIYLYLSEKILIIDDEADYCLLMRGFFKRKGYDVNIAPTLREGKDMLASWQPDILFLDNNLPDGNGWDSIEGIVEKNPQIRAYLISAHRNYSPLMNQYANIVVWEKPISMDMLNRVF